MPGRVPTGYGHESQDCHFQGGNIFNYEASGLFWIENQVSLDANELVMCKAQFKQWLYNPCVCKVKHYHGDNGIFSAEEFWHSCEEKRQSQSSPVLAPQNQNARAEQSYSDHHVYGTNFHGSCLPSLDRTKFR
jgi:hypothetical protein